MKNRLLSNSLKKACFKRYEKKYLLIIDKLKNKFPNLNFNKFEIKTLRYKSIVICKKCKREYKMSLSSLLKRNNNFCLNCLNKVFDTLSFIIQANKVHKSSYDYSKVKYVLNHIKVEIICKKHGSYYMTPNNHVSAKQGCPKCKLDKLKKIFLKKENEFLKQCNKIHNNKYDYTLVRYTGAFNKIKIICPIHGEFLQIAKSHLKGHGCLKCSNFSKGEKEIKNVLLKNNIKFIEQKHFTDCKRKKKSTLRFDFYLPKYNIVIEYHGEQHYKPIKWFGGEKKFKDLQERDYFKKNYCKNKGIHYLEISHKMYNKIEDIINKYI